MLFAVDLGCLMLHQERFRQCPNVENRKLHPVHFYQLLALQKYPIRLASLADNPKTWLALIFMGLLK
jgi:hypothetical protein